MIRNRQRRPDGDGKSGILFDLDGVLWDSAPAHAEAFRQAFAEAGLPPPGDYADIAGMKTEEVLIAHLERHGRPADESAVRAVASRKRELARLFLRDKATPAPGLNDALHRLSRFYRLALCSSASPGTVACFMEKSGLFALFEIVLDGSCVERAKPAPDIYTLGARRLGLAPSEVWVIEDSRAGVTAGRAAGMDVIGVGTDIDALRSWGCRAFIPEIRHLPDLLAIQPGLPLHADGSVPPA